MTRKQEYAAFLETTFWVELSARVRRERGRCAACGATARLQCHHHHYPPDWNDTRPEHLTVLCRNCHEKEHGLAPSPAVGIDDDQIPEHAFIVPPGRKRFWTMGLLNAMRSRGKLTRVEFLELRGSIRSGQKVALPPRLAPRIKPKTHKRPNPPKRQGCAPWHYNDSVKPQWKNRGNSSN